jgi:toxin-antitoxin system PIN domain toxin
VIVDANVLLFAEDRSSPHHGPALEWLTDALNGPIRTGLPWPSLLAFVRIRTNPRAFERPLSPGDAWSRVTAWLAAPSAWVPRPTERHADLLGQLIVEHHLGSSLIPDAHLAALALEHGVGVCARPTPTSRGSPA